MDKTKQDLPLSGPARHRLFSHVYQGPVATQLLADYGADVIKLERPGKSGGGSGGGDWSRAWGPFVKGVSLPFANLNRNKRSITVDMKQPDGMAVVLDLIDNSDVLVHNFRGGVMEKLGLGYDELKRSGTPSSSTPPAAAGATAGRTSTASAAGTT